MRYWIAVGVTAIVWFVIGLLVGAYAVIAYIGATLETGPGYKARK